MASSEFARSSRSLGTMSGISESFAGSKSVARLAMAKLMTNTLQIDQSAANGTSSTRTIRASSAASIRWRLLNRSIATPANIPNST